MVISNHFLYQDLVQHPSETAKHLFQWMVVSGSRIMFSWSLLDSTKTRGSWCLRFWKEPEVATFFFCISYLLRVKMVIHFCNDDCNLCSLWRPIIIFQEKFFLYITHLIFVEMDMDGFQAGEDRHGMLGFYLGARDEEERPQRSCRGGNKTTAKQKHHCWSKTFQCLDQCFNFHGFSIMFEKIWRLLPLCSWILRAPPHPFPLSRRWLMLNGSYQLNFEVKCQKSMYNYIPYAPRMEIFTYIYPRFYDRYIGKYSIYGAFG